MTLKLKTPPMPKPDRAKAAINCTHCIEEGRLSLYFDPAKPGHNVMNQLGNRLAEVEREQLAARDAQWLELVGPVVKALKSMLERYVSLVNSGDAGNWDPEGEPEVAQSRAALRAITEEQE